MKDPFIPAQRYNKSLSLLPHLRPNGRRRIGHGERGQVAPLPQDGAGELPRCAGHVAAVPCKKELNVVIFFTSSAPMRLSYNGGESGVGELGTDVLLGRRAVRVRIGGILKKISIPKSIVRSADLDTA